MQSILFAHPNNGVWEPLPAAHIQHILMVGEKQTLTQSTVPFPSWFPVKEFSPVLQQAVTDSMTVWQPATLQTHHVQSLSLWTVDGDRSRHMGHIRSDLIADGLAKHIVGKEGNVLLLVVVTHLRQHSAVVAAISRAFPLYNKKTSGATVERTVTRSLYVDFLAASQDLVAPLASSLDRHQCQLLSDAVRLSAKLVDMPTSELHTDSYVALIRERMQSLPNVRVTFIQGRELDQQGFGGLWGVGKAAAHLPALVVLSYQPASPKSTMAWVGKGIVYDTGGLCIKGSTNMPTMKCDMGGSAAILAAFEAAVLAKHPNTLHAVLCLAENSVSAESTRPDDILYMYSGKSVEVNNTDAEGRLVLADGVAYATKHLKPDVVVDVATLTGAQGIATGQRHAAILCNDSEFEQVAYRVGQDSGDWVYPILYAPELLKKEFSSEVADMKNSVKNRANAQSSCAGHFIEDHLDASFRGKWLHVDIAGPAFKDGRGTGFGTAFLLQLARSL